MTGREGALNPNLLIRRYPCGRPDPFRSVRDLWLVPGGCPRKSGGSGSRSFVWLPAWLPAAHDSWPSWRPGPHHHWRTFARCADRAVCSAQTPPPNPTAAEPRDGRVLSRPSSRVHEPGNYPGSRCPAVTDGLYRFRESHTLLRRLRGRTPTLPPACRAAGNPRIKRQARPCSKPFGSVRSFGLSWLIRSVRYVQIQRCITALLLTLLLAGLPGAATSSVSGLLGEQAHVRQARSRCARRCPGVAVTTLSRPPPRARGGHDLPIRRTEQAVQDGSDIGRRYRWESRFFPKLLPQRFHSSQCFPGPPQPGPCGEHHRPDSPQ